MFGNRIDDFLSQRKNLTTSLEKLLRKIRPSIDLVQHPDVLGVVEIVNLFEAPAKSLDSRSDVHLERVLEVRQVGRRSCRVNVSVPVVATSYGGQLRMSGVVLSDEIVGVVRAPRTE